MPRMKRKSPELICKLRKRSRRLQQASRDEQEAEEEVRVLGLSTLPGNLKIKEEPEEFFFNPDVPSADDILEEHGYFLGPDKFREVKVGGDFPQRCEILPQSQSDDDMPPDDETKPSLIHGDDKTKPSSAEDIMVKKEEDYESPASPALSGCSEEKHLIASQMEDFPLVPDPECQSDQDRCLVIQPIPQPKNLRSGLTDLPLSWTLSSAGSCMQNIMDTTVPRMVEIPGEKLAFPVGHPREDGCIEIAPVGAPLWKDQVGDKVHPTTSTCTISSLEHAVERGLVQRELSQQDPDTDTGSLPSMSDISISEKAPVRWLKKLMYMKGRDKKEQKCHLCKKIIRAHMLLDHACRKLGDLEFTCRFCDKKFATIRSIKQHMKKEHWDTETRDYQCSTCFTKFDNAHSLLFHTLKAKELGINCSVLTIPVSSKPKQYKCSICRETFKSQVGQIRHAACHSGKIKYQCNTCCVVFESCADLKCHREKYLQAGSDCSIFTMKLSAAVSEQNIEDTRDRPNLEGAEVGATNPESLTGPVKGPEGSGQCTMCFKHFSNIFVLKNHITEHFTDKPGTFFPCHICGKILGNIYMLKYHQVDVHQDDSWSIEEVPVPGQITQTEVWFTCNVCQKSFKYEVGLKKHMKTHAGCHKHLWRYLS